LVGASLSAATREKGEVSGCVSELSREFAFDAEGVALVFEESFSAGVSVEATETGADSGADTNSVLDGSVGGAATTFPEVGLLVPTVPVPGELEPLSPDEVPVEPDVLPAPGAPGDEEDEGGGLVGGGVDAVEGSPSPEDDPPVEEEPPVEPEEEPLETELSAPSSLPPSSNLLPEPEPSSPAEAPPEDE
jgi:hypothetical protein